MTLYVPHSPNGENPLSEREEEILLVELDYFKVVRASNKIMLIQILSLFPSCSYNCHPSDNFT